MCVCVCVRACVCLSVCLCFPKDVNAVLCLTMVLSVVCDCSSEDAVDIIVLNGVYIHISGVFASKCDCMVLKK